MITGCQQQQVPEIFYDLDAQSMASKTRAMEQQILYQAPFSMVIDKELQLFHGNVLSIDTSTENKKKSAKIKVKNDMEVVLDFEVSPEVAALMHIEMEIAVRYMRDQKKNKVVEIKKAAW
jgi:hypothetical protein